MIGVIGSTAEYNVLGDFVAVDLTGLNKLHEGGLHGVGCLPDVVHKANGEGFGVE